MGKKENTTLTSVNVPNKLFEDFKIACVRYKFSITKLTERAIYLYLTDEEFRKQLHNQHDIDYPIEESQN